jgi:hypothetical protein
MNEIFPHIKTKFKPSYNKLVTIECSTWVRIKRAKKYYKVYCKVESQEYSTDPDFGKSIVSTQKMAVRNAESMQYLWVVPPKSMRLKMISDGHLVQDTRLLTNKELFLLDFKG